jgi:DNA-binding CsgD family transcriptional regulator
VGIVLAGVLADYRQRRYLAVVTLASMLANIFPILLLSRAHTYDISSAALYFFASFFIMFITVVFIDIAPATDSPRLWAGMGRILKFAFTGVGAEVGEKLWRTAPLQTNLAVFTTLLILLFFLMLVVYNPLKFPENRPPAPEAAPEESPASAGLPDKFRSRYRFTERELEVLDLILLGRSIKDIAVELSISERTVKHHIANVLEKTDTKNQRELLVLVNRA